MSRLVGPEGQKIYVTFPDGNELSRTRFGPSQPQEAPITEPFWWMAMDVNRGESLVFQSDSGAVLAQRILQCLQFGLRFDF